VRRAGRLPLLAAALAVMLPLSAQPANADTANDLAQAQAQAALFEQVRQQLGSSLADGLAAQSQIVKSLQQNQEQQDAQRQKIAAANARIADLDTQIDRLNRDIAVTERRIEIERIQLRSLARAIYVQPGSALVMLGASRNLSDLLTRIADLASAGSRARTLKHALNDDLVKLEVDRAKQEAARDEQVKLRGQLQADLAALEDLRAKQEDSKQKLEIKIAQTRNELLLIKNQSAQLAQQIADLLQQQQAAIIAAAMQQVWDQVRIYQQQNQIGPIASSAGHSKQYRFMWPEPDAQISQGSGPSTLWFEPAYQGFAHFHTGIDLVLPAGSPVLAADDGIVILVGSGNTGYGNYVVLEHTGGLTTLYGHLSTAVVKVGQQVSQSQPVGLEGSTGNSTGPHLHFELRIDGKPVDPSPYLPPGPPSAFRG
jgi:murein DD-endopeptidase MepM/ murein hydrolase activator NlpD